MVIFQFAKRCQVITSGSYAGARTAGLWRDRVAEAFSEGQLGYVGRGQVLGWKHGNLPSGNLLQFAIESGT
jgi:hypothetical protein